MRIKDHQLIRAQAQCYVGLENAFQTIDASAIPSLNPEQLENYLNIRKSLLKTYHVKDTKNYRFTKPMLQTKKKS